MGIPRNAHVGHLDHTQPRPTILLSGGVERGYRCKELLPRRAPATVIVQVQIRDEHVVCMLAHFVYEAPQIFIAERRRHRVHQVAVLIPVVGKGGEL